MRIIGGNLKGRRINPPANLQARPTTDMAKESLFNILNNMIDFEEVSVLDMFAGTGSISLEFVSRGCHKVVAIEKSSINHSFIRKAIQELKVDCINLIKGDTFKFVETTGEKWDLIFADPPYDLKELPTIPDIVFERNLLKEDGIFILEHPKNYSFETHPRFSEHRNYGHVNFTFFK
ncbi:MAG: 16S rRNA (guanine(966)-N(2))-methyltransferase RsmD [Paludibacteraceae bacterium]|nr:16S rRNA (guanine(966)-N(2))-methyltransferase RsmD [Paludibacteraceae bacterium]